MQINISPNQTYPNMLSRSIHDILERRSSNPSSPRNSWCRMPRWLPPRARRRSRACGPRGFYRHLRLIPSWQIHQFSSVRCHIQVHVRCCAYECLKFKVFPKVPKGFRFCNCAPKIWLIRYAHDARPTFHQSECHTPAVEARKLAAHFWHVIGNGWVYHIIGCFYSSHLSMVNH